MTYRDSKGRMRDEFFDSKNQMNSVMIVDELSNAHYILNPIGKTGIKLSLQVKLDFSSLEKNKSDDVEIITIGDDKKIAEKRVIVLQSTLAKNGTKESTEKNGSPKKTEQIIIRTKKDNEFASNLNIQLSGNDKWRSKATAKNLGTKEIEGVKAEGRLLTYEIPVGEVGNVKAITITEETWTSPELKITLYSKMHDPRGGETIYQVRNLKRQDVPESMFVAPSDYKISEPLKKIELK
jgi:hypothetical protein